METSYSVKSLLLNGNETTKSASPKSNFTISVEGNIGSGKSTMLNYFETCESCLIETLCEPIEKWTDVQGHNALGLLYEDPQRWNFTFNMYAMLTRVSMLTQLPTKPVKMLERSLHSTRNCFIQNSYNSNSLSGCEFSILNQWYDHLVSDGKANLDLIIYLRADPGICHERLKKRSRKEETGVPMNFLESLHTLHDDWLIDKQFPLPAPVIVLDANPDISVMHEKYNQILQEMKELVIE